MEFTLPNEKSFWYKLMDLVDNKMVQRRLFTHNEAAERNHAIKNGYVALSNRRWIPCHIDEEVGFIW